MNLRLMLLLIGGVILFVIFFDVWWHKRKHHKRSQTELDSTIKSVGSTKTFSDAKTSVQSANGKGYTKAIEPVIGDPTLAELGFGDKEDFSAILADNRPKSINNPTTNNRTPLSPSTILIINVLAPKGQKFLGYELLQTLLAVGMRYGDMSIFHYFQMQDGKEQALFSLTSATEPGIFDLTNVGGLSCSGLSLFLRVNNPKYAQQNFELMLEVARQLADDLGGDLYDEQRQPLTVETLKSYRARIAS